VQLPRLTLPALLAVALLPASPAGATGHRLGVRPAAVRPPRALLSHAACVTALDPSARSVDVTAVMRPVPGTEAMAVRFVLLQRPPGGTFTAVLAPGLGSWISPRPATLGQRPGDVWRVQHPVSNLPAPARYRFRVTFRWTGRHGRVLRSSTLLGPDCAQPELRPDLVVDSVVVRPGSTPKLSNRYLVTIGDLGATGAGPFTVALTDAGQTVAATVPTIAAHARSVVAITGPVCQAGGTVTVDPQEQVDVSSRAGATLAFSCPPAPTPTTTTSAAG
jgi:hypothetical protein